MPRIDPDKEVKHGQHIDYYWPGVVHSVWKSSDWFELRRERTYKDKNHQDLKHTTWQLRLRKSHFGFRR